jgi:hypothetical protein
MKYLTSYAQEYRVAAVIDSCFSGNLIRKKLVEDHDATGNPVKNFCLVASSYFGKTTILNPIESLMKIEKGKNLEDFYLNGPGGMISSAAWDAAGVTKLFTDQSTDLVKNSIAAIEMMNSIIKQHSTDACSLQDASVSAQACLHPEVNQLNFLALADLVKSELIPKDKIKNNLDQLAKLINLKEGDRAQHDPNWILCAKSYKQHFEALYQKKPSEQFIQAEAMIQSLGEFRSSAEYAYCNDNQKNKPPEIVEGIKRVDPPRDPQMRALAVAMYYGTSLDEKISEELFRRGASKIEDLEIRHCLSDIGSQLSVYETNRIKFERLIKKNVQAKKCVSNTRSGFIKNIFEEGLLGKNETSEKWEVRTSSSDKSLSTDKVLNEFNRASLKIDHYTNPIDEARRQACREWKF